MLAEAALILALLERIEQASHAEPPVFQIATLIESARVLPIKDFGPRRREFLEQARRISAAVTHEPSRAVFQIETAHLMKMQDPDEAARWCRQLRGEAHPAVQVPDCEIALAHGTGGNLATRMGSATLILGRSL